MIRSMYSGVSGMAAHQTKLNVIGNNIANVNTYGFKSSRVVFSDVLYQNMNTATAPTNDAGGVNASQMGYGAKVGTIDVINSLSAGADTGRALDVYINGEGYLPVRANDGSVKFTRVGNLKFDTAGNLTDGNGSMILGIPTDETTGAPLLNADGSLDVNGLKVINIAPEKLEKCTGISIGLSGEITGIMAGDPTFTQALGTGWIQSTEMPKDSLYGGNVTLTTIPGADVEFASADPVAITGVAISGTDVDIIGDLTLKKATSTSGNVTYTLTGTNKAGVAFTKATTILAADVGTTTSLSFDTNSDGTDGDVTVDNLDTEFITDGTTKLGTVGATTMSITATVYDQGGTAQKIILNPTDPTNGWIAGQTSLTIGDLTLTIDPAKFSAVSALTDSKIGTIAAGSSVPVSLAYLSVAKFANVDGLSRDGDGYYTETPNSGAAVVAKAGTKGTGTLKSNSLEMSNVDLSKEFTEMITAQRGFQANTRIVTVSDSILEELINLKR